jgi:hypothetical protein
VQFALACPPRRSYIYQHTQCPTRGLRRRRDLQPRHTLCCLFTMVAPAATCQRPHQNLHWVKHTPSRQNWPNQGPTDTNSTAELSGQQQGYPRRQHAQPAGLLDRQPPAPSPRFSNCCCCCRRRCATHAGTLACCSSRNFSATDMSSGVVTCAGGGQGGSAVGRWRARRQAGGAAWRRCARHRAPGSLHATSTRTSTSTSTSASASTPAPPRQHRQHRQHRPP